MSALIPCRDDDGLGTPMAPVVCMWCKCPMGAKACTAAQAGKISHSVCPTCWAALERGENLVPGECLEGQDHYSRFGLAPADADSPAPLTSPGKLGADVVAAAPGVEPPLPRVNGVSTPADEAAVLEHLSGDPAAASATFGGPVPRFWCVTGADFARSIRWARQQGSALAQHVAACRAAGLGTKDQGQGRGGA